MLSIFLHIFNSNEILHVIYEYEGPQTVYLSDT